MEKRLYMRHIRQCKYCISEFRKFCEDRNFDYKGFLKNGIAIEDLKILMGNERHTLVDRAINMAEKEKDI